MYTRTQKPDGNSSSAALRRLRKDRPDLHAKVLGGELSPILDSIGIPKSTAYWWIDRYKESVGLMRRAARPGPLGGVGNKGKGIVPMLEQLKIPVSTA